MNIKDSPMQRRYIEKQCKRFNCDIDGLLRNHEEILTKRLRNQAQAMYHEKFGRYFKENQA